MILHKPDADAGKETVDTVVEAVTGHRRSRNRAARVVASPAKLDIQLAAMSDAPLMRELSAEAD